jgi:hypothetical protein
MGLITSLAVGFVVFLLVHYFAPGLSIWVAVFVAGFAAGILAEGILKGLFVGLVVAVVGVFIVTYFMGGIPGIDTNDIIGSLVGIAGAGIVVLSAVAGIAGSYLRRSRVKK